MNQGRPLGDGATGAPNEKPESPYPGLGGTEPVRNDPAFQPPGDPTANPAQLRTRVLVITREIPNVVIQNGWQVQDVRNAISDLTSGLFDRPSQLLDAMAGDGRVQSAFRQRSGGLLGRPLSFRPPKKLRDDPTAIKCSRLWVRHWENMQAEPGLLDLLERSACMGFAYWQLLWDTGGKRWLPYAQTFDTRFAFYHWDFRVHVAVHRDGIDAITPGDGHWVLHAPYGSYRGWMRGALRAMAQWFLVRQYTLRDWARYCERHGYPLILADTPFGADPTDISNLTIALTNLGQENILQVPGSVDLQKYGKYDLRYLEPKDRNWQAFKELIEQCNAEITLCLLGQNLTTEVKEGSLAAARVHGDVRQIILEADARALERTLYVQVLRPFAALNFGDARFAPVPKWDVRPQEDLEQKARTLQGVGTGVNQLRLGGKRIKNLEEVLRTFGFKGVELEDVDPVQIAAKLAGATGTVDPSAGVAPDKSGKIDEQLSALTKAMYSDARKSSFSQWLESIGPMLAEMAKKNQ